MSWTRASFRDQKVWVEVEADGTLREVGGRVAIRYSDQQGAKLYRAGTAGVTRDASAAIVALPDGSDADEPKAAGAKKRGSGFGSAGSRTAAQATAAAADARDRIDAAGADTWRCFTDGSCRGNPGPAGSGVLVKGPAGVVVEASKSLGRATNNIAELTAIGLALDLLDHQGVDNAAPAVVFTDSTYAIGVLQKGWKAKANTELIRSLRLRLEVRTGARLQWVAGHAGVAENERADALANRGMEGVTRTDGPAPAQRSSTP